MIDQIRSLKVKASKLKSKILMLQALTVTLPSPARRYHLRCSVCGYSQWHILQRHTSLLQSQLDLLTDSSECMESS